MRRYFKYIFLTLITVIFAASCIEEMESPQPMPQSDALTLVPRVKSFTNQYVTKAEGDEAAYTQAETKITHLAYLIFDRNGNLVKMDEADVQNGNGLTLNKTNLNSSETSATVVMFANVNLDDIKKEVTGEDETTSIIKITDDEELSLEGLDDYSIYLNSDPVVLSGDLSGSGFKGFPMKGNAENVNLTTASTDPIVVNLQILYAKVYFEIGVAAGTENQNYEGVTPQFEISGYSVHNVSKITTVAELGEEDATASDDYAYTGSSSKVGSLPTSSNKVASTSGNTKVDFTFYMAESCYNHGGISGVYPVGDLPEDVKQQYKPKLATNGTGLPSTGLATYVTINGKYKDYRGTEWTVNYKVYLGKNSYDDFHVDRNSEYKNFLTIKGIRNNDTYTDAGSVWIDHRVNVSTDDPSKHVTITRETLIDSHIEVRPLRVSFAGSSYDRAAIYLPKYPVDNSGNVIYDNTTSPASWKQLDEIMGGANENWIAIENNNGTANKGRLYLPSGKRKYFTTSLIEELHAESADITVDSEGNRFISLVDGDCAWIYFDENATSNTRRAMIDVVFYSSDASIIESYDVYQAGYCPMGDLKVENYEEYLHSYDSADKYNLSTSFVDYTQQGLPWGFTSERVSAYMHASPIQLDPINLGLVQADPKDFISDEVRYDYFHEDDGSNYYLYLHDGSEWVDAEFGTGLDFTMRAANARNMTVADMGAVPLSAYQYCLSKNKFHEDADGNHSMIIRWYLPDVYELNSLFLNSNTLGDMDRDAFYWSSQPSSTDYGLASIGGEIGDYFKASSIKNEVVDKARAVSASGIEDIERETTNRIRCLYDANGKSVDMSDRVPSGLGGLIKIPMKAYVSYTNEQINVPGYFHAWLTDIDDDDDSTPNLPSYDFPTGTNAHALDAFESNGVYYYVKDPTTRDAWQYSSINIYDNTLYRYPGLTAKEVESAGGLESLKYVESTDDKLYERSETIIGGEKLEAIPSNAQLAIVPLDYLEDSDILTISFDKGTNSNTVSYSYRREDRTTTTYQRKWEVPTYRQINVNESSGSVVTKVNVGSITYGLRRVGDEYEYNGETHIITNKYTEGGILSRKYYFDLGPKTTNRPGYKYESPGKWGEEKPIPPTKSTKQDKDKLDLFGGNSFTIKAKEGYRIKSIKVNFSDNNKVNNITGDLVDLSYRYLRLVEDSQQLPSTDAPAYMSYSGDGETGWYQWSASTVEEYATSVTLKLVAYSPENNLRPTSFQYVAPSSNGITTGYQSDFETSIVIDSFEIRIEEVDEPTTIE